MFDSIVNRAEFFSDHYLDARLATDLEILRRSWDSTEGHDRPTARTGLRSAARPFFAARATVAEASEAAARTDAIRVLNDVVLAALGFAPERGKVLFERATGTDELVVPVAARVETATGPLLIAVDAGAASEVDELFDTDPREEGTPPGYLLEPLTRDGGKVKVTKVADVPGEVFSVDDPPRFVLLCGGSTLVLAERSKWAEGRFLAVELDTALERSDVKAKGELETIAALFSADALVPGHLAGEDQAGASFFDEVDDRQNKHAVGVSKELREGMRRSVEVLANEVIEQRLAKRMGVYDGENRVDPTDLTRQCLRYLYRLIVLLYAESRPELGVLPTDDDAYLAGYSLDRLRELMLVDLNDEHARNGTHLDESLRLLFQLVNDGYHASEAQQAFVFDADTPNATRSTEDYLQFPGLDATIFDPGSTPLLDSVPLRNEALQRVLVLLMLNRESKRRSEQRGFISYAQLGINQLGAVYEGLMAYTGFFAREDLYEVAKGGDPKDGTWMVPVTAADDYPDEVFVRETDPISGRVDRVCHEKGSFVYRLAGRDRQRSASYYKPEFLTSCVVRHALAELLGTDEYARVPGGSAGITEARRLLDLTVCEPALGSGAFLNEAINQLSAEYLKRRQAELGETLDAETYQRELQKVKAHFALHQCYGVDLNATAVELAEVSLWLNCMYPGLKAPWFGLRLRRGNSLVGCRRATWPAKRLKDKVWAKDKAADAVPPTDRPLSVPLGPDEIHHFLLPGHGWGAVAGRKEAKEFAPAEAKALGEWRKAILKAPGPANAHRLAALAASVERLWAEATDLLTRLDKRIRRPLDLYGAEFDKSAPDDDRHAAEKILNNPESSLGRLRLVMDAWVGLWFWTLGPDIAPPSWHEWLSTLERIVGAEPTEPTGQLDLFADLAAIESIESKRAAGRESVATVLSEAPWLARAVDLARREGAWHWPLEFAPIFARGGFDLQLGNPPWTKLYRSDTGFAEDLDPHWGLVGPPEPPKLLHALKQLLLSPDLVHSYLVETASSEATRSLLSSAQLWPFSSGLLLNLYFIFMQVTWRNCSAPGATGLLHPESHFVDPDGGLLREATYTRLRRHWQFLNELKLFEDIGNVTPFGVHIYGEGKEVTFLQVSHLLHPDTVDRSLVHDGSGPTPAIKFESGVWDLRPHSDRVLTVSEGVLRNWARLFDPTGTPAVNARLLRPVTTAEVDILSVLADQPVRLLDRAHHLSSGWHEKGAKTDGIIRWETEVPSGWQEVILQGPHFSVANPFYQWPKMPCLSHRHWDPLDLEALPEKSIPRTNYQRASDRETYDAHNVHWEGRPSTAKYRHIHREMTQPGLERSVQGAIIPPGASHIHACMTCGFEGTDDLMRWAGLLASMSVDYLFKVSAATHIAEPQLEKLPFPHAKPVDNAVQLRVLRLNCLTSEYARLWEEAYNPVWAEDRWTDPIFDRIWLGAIDSIWTMDTPLRRDFERRLALVEIDALVALMLDLTAEQLRAIYRSQFAVLRKYEYAMAFDTEGRKICAHHQSAGYRQLELQREAKDKQRAPQWTNVWKMFQQWEEDPDSVDWEDQYFPPFTRPDREAEMTRAYNEFQRRLDAGEYG